MATGKTSAPYSRVYVDGYDLSPDSFAYSIATTFTEDDFSGLSSNIKETGADISDISANLKLWFDDALSGAYTRLRNGGGLSHMLTIAQGIGSLPAAGDPAHSGQMMQLDTQTDIAIGKAVGMSVKFGSATVGTPGLATPFGVLLHPNAHETATANGVVIDNLAQSLNGAQGFLHVTVAGGVWVITIQHDTVVGMGTATTLMTFSSNGSTITSEVQSATGTVKRYVRAVATRTSGNLDYVLSLVRG